jgi:hypothetical protein
MHRIGFEAKHILPGLVATGGALPCRSGTSMAAPFAAGVAALALAILAANDQKYFNRGAEIRDFLRNLTTTSPGLSAAGSVAWGNGFSPNAVLDWAGTCNIVSKLYSVTDDTQQLIAGVDGVGTKSAVLEPGSDFPRVLGEAFARGVVLQLYEGAGRDEPDALVAPGPRQPDFEMFIPSNVNFGPAVGGALISSSCIGAVCEMHETQGRAHEQPP